MRMEKGVNEIKRSEGRVADHKWELQCNQLSSLLCEVRDGIKKQGNIRNCILTSSISSQCGQPWGWTRRW